MNVLIHHNDNARTGANLNETTLTIANVAAGLGRLFERKVDGACYAQPLYVAGVRTARAGARNVLFVATMRNFVYAFDADDPAASAPLWGPISLGPYIHLPDGQIGPGGYGDIEWEVGIVSTPVIDVARRAIYVLATTRDGDGYHHKLHRLDIGSGAIVRTSQAVASAIPSFRSERQNQRAALTLANNRVYAGFASYGDRTPYHGWVVAFDADTAQAVLSFNTTPAHSQGEGGIWQAGEGLAVDGSGNLYFMTGNSSFDGNTDLGTCCVKLSPDLQRSSWFSPFNNGPLNADLDLGSAGVMLIPGTQRLVGGGKEGKLYLLNDANLGGIGSGNDNQIPQSFFVNQGHHIHGSPVIWSGPMGTWIYIWPEVDFLRAYSFAANRFTVNGANQVVPAAMGTTGLTPGMPGGFLSVSANQGNAGTGIVWANHPWSEDLNQQAGEGVLRAYDASTLTEIWNSRTRRARDDFGNFAKFCPPTVAAGKVYLPTMGGLHRKVTIWSDTAREGASLANLGDQLLVLGWTGTDDPGHLNVRWSSDGIGWNGKNTNWSETSMNALALSPGFGRLFMAWTGTDSRLNVHTSNDCVAWFNKKTLDETSKHGPALAFGGGRLFLAWTGTDARLNVLSSTDGVSWDNKVTLGETSPTAPGLAFVNGSLILLWCGTDRKLNVMQSADGVSWGSKRTFGETSDAAPAVAGDVSTLFFAWHGSGNNQINQMTARDGVVQDVTDKRTFRDSGNSGPSLTSFQNRLYVGWAGTEFHPHLNVAVLSLGGVSAYGLL